VVISLLVLVLLEYRSTSGETALKDVTNLIQIISWPIVVAIALLLLYKPISRFLESLGQNFQTVKLSILQVTLEVSKASASEFTPTWVDATGSDLRRSPGDEITTSGKPSLFEQFKGSVPLDYALIDIGDGKQWLTSRLFIFAIMLERMRGLQHLVFVETTSDVQKRFLGIASPREVRWKIAMLNPWLEPAFAKALFSMQYLGYVPNPAQQLKVPDSPPHLYNILSVKGALETSAAESLVIAFLKDPNIQRNVAPGGTEVDWEEITRRNKTSFWEHAHWIDRNWILKRDDIINRNAFCKSSPDDSPKEQTQAILRRKGAFIALVDEEKQFEKLLDRHDLLEKVVANLRKQLDEKAEAKQQMRT